MIYIYIHTHTNTSRDVSLAQNILKRTLKNTQFLSDNYTNK